MSTESNSAVAHSVNKRFDGLFRSSLDWLYLSFVIGFAPLLYVHFVNLWQKKHLQFFPLAVAALVWLIVAKGQVGDSVDTRRKRLGALAMLLALAAALAALTFFSPWIAHLGFAFATLGWLMLRLTNVPLHIVFLWGTLLLVWLPLPMNLDTTLIQNLQSVSTQSASALLDLFGIPHYSFGNVLELKTGKLFVDEACSGVDSLYALAASVLLLLIWNGKPFATSLLSFLLVPAWAWLGNVFRITFIAWMLHAFGIDLSHGWTHTLLGMVVFGTVFGCALLTGKLLEIALAPFSVKSASTSSWCHQLYNRLVTWPGKNPLKRRSSKDEEPLARSDASIANKTPLQSGLTYAICALLVLVGAASALPLMRIGPWERVFAGLPDIPEREVRSHFVGDLLPNEFGTIRFQKFEIDHREKGSLYGEYSAIWSYVDLETGQPILFSVDFPFPGYHTLERCYELSGNELTQEAREVVEVREQAQIIAYDSEMVDALKNESYLTFLVFDQQGNSIAQPDLLSRGVFDSGFIPVTFQVQVFLPNCGPLSEQLKSRYQQVLVEGFKRVLPAVQKIKI